MQLGIEVNGRFAYPFTFTANPQVTNGVTLSPGGLLSGTPTTTADQNTQITVKDSNGMQIAQYSIALKVASSVTVMLTSAPVAGAAPATADPASPAVKTSKAASANAISTNPIYANGDTIKGAIAPNPAAKTNPPTTTGNDGATQQQAPSSPSGNAGGVTPAPVTTGDTTPADTSGNGSSAKGSGAKAKPQDLGGTIVNIKCTTMDTAGHSGCDPKVSATATTADDGSFSYQFHKSLFPGDEVLLSLESGPTQTNVVQTAPSFLGEKMRAIVGYQQTGGSSSSFTQDWFLDFYISRPLAFHNKSDDDSAKWRWWGNVRVASFPQPGNQALAEVAAGLSAQLGALKLNQLAEGAELLIGPEYQWLKSRPFRGFSENTRQVFTLGIIGAFGATGFFSAPSQNLQVFDVPAAISPQYPIFIKAFPSVTTPHVAFVSPDLERFPKQYLGGFRLETHYFDPTGKPLTSPPAMLAFTIGQNQVITSDQLRGVVARFEAFYPLPFGNRGETKAGAFSSVYLFGTAQMRLGRTLTAPPLALAPSTGINASDPTVTLVPLPNTRDLYRIGFGVDLIGFVSSLTGGTSKPSTTGTSPKSETSTPSPSPTTPQNSHPANSRAQNPPPPSDGVPANQ